MTVETNGVGVDLDAAGAAREEARKGKPVPYLTFRGKRFDLESEIPYDVYRKMGHIAANTRAMTDLEAGILMGEIVEAFLGSRWEAFEKLSPSLQDVAEAYKEIFRAYSVSVGESSASPRSSNGTGSQRKPRSKPGTE